MRREQLSSTEPLNDYDRIELLNVHPPAWRNPEPVDRYNLVVVGAGPAGLLTALNAAKLGAQIAIIERDRFGGACFNVGCIPSKAIIRTSRLYGEMRNAENFGACRHQRGLSGRDGADAASAGAHQPPSLGT